MAAVTALGGTSSSVSSVRIQRKTAESGTDFSGFLNAAASGFAAQGPQNLESVFSRAAQTYGVPENLLKAVAKAESDFQPDAVSSCGAQGVMQLMPSTAASLGVSNPFDAGQNIMGGAKYLSGLISSYNGDVKLALAAYNAGSGNVKKYGGIPPFAETQNYVKRVLAYAGGTSLSVPDFPQSSPDPGSGFSAPVSTQQAAFRWDGLSFSSDDYSLFVKMFAERLEQDALDRAEGSVQSAGAVV